MYGLELTSTKVIDLGRQVKGVLGEGVGGGQERMWGEGRGENNHNTGKLYNSSR